MIGWLLTGGAVPILVLGCGGFLLVYLRGRPLRHPLRMLRAMRAPSEAGGVSPFRAVMLALAGTLGVGNIVGVANALALGGAGALFWMWCSALLAMILKYAEILLAVAHRRRDRRGGFFGGAYYYVRDALEGRGRFRAAAVEIKSLSSGAIILPVCSSLESLMTKCAPIFTMNRSVTV